MEDKGKLKGKDSSMDEERQLCRSYINVSEDPVIGAGQTVKAFWKRVSAHYMQHLPADSVKRSERLLETRFGEIETDVGKFVGVHASVQASNESGTTEEDVLEKSHILFKVKNKKAFKYVHCWEILRSIPKYWTYRDEEKRSMSKRKLIGTISEPNFIPESGTACSGVIHHMAESEFTTGVGPSFVGRPKGAKTAKLEAKLMAQIETAKKIQAKAIENLAAAKFERNKILRDQQVLALFSMPTGDTADIQFKEYLKLRRAEELKRLKLHLKITAADDTQEFLFQLLIK